MSASRGTITTWSGAVRRHLPTTLWLGLCVILFSEVFLFIDAGRRGWAVVPRTPAEALPQPGTVVGWIARWFAADMTPVCWVGYLLVMDGLLTWLRRRRAASAEPGKPGKALTGGSPIRLRPNRFVTVWLTSIPVWCFFDWVNFYYMHAWRYHGLPPLFIHRLIGYFIAFAAIAPGMFLAAQVYLTLMPADGPRTTTGGDTRPGGSPLAWVLTLGPAALIAAAVLVLLGLREGPMGRPWFMAGSGLLLIGPAAAMLAWRRPVRRVALATGVGFVAWTFLARDPLSNLTLWVGLIFLLDPLNAALDRRAPSLLRDWRAGRWRRSFALAAGGLTCGLLWEFWNYWAIAKWTYHLPFLGPTEHVRYFEMPVLGLLGFIPFAGECWVMFNTIVVLLTLLGLRVAEPLPHADAVI